MSSDEVRWSYSLILENRGRTAAEVLRGFASVSLGAVTASPESVVDQRRTIAAGELLRIPHTAVFRPSDFNAAPIAGQKMVKWQFWGKYEDGEAIILNAEVVR